MSDVKVLVLEPDEQIRRLLITLLTHDGYSVTTTTDGAEAAKAFKRDHFAAFVVDVSLRDSVLERGVWRGLGFLHYLQHTRPELMPRVIVTSAIAPRQLRVQLPAVGRVLQKPFDIEELREAVAVRTRSYSRTRLPTRSS